jgi:hypothetical protein
MDDPGDWQAKLPGLLYSKPNMRKRIGVIGDGSQAARGEFILHVNYDKSLHAWILLRNILGLFI